MSIDEGIDVGLDTDLTELRAALARHPFPTGQDDILALLVARHEPSRLLWRAAALSGPGYASADGAATSRPTRSARRSRSPPARACRHRRPLIRTGSCVRRRAAPGTTAFVAPVASGALRSWRE